jgi:hypothetical protein
MADPNTDSVAPQSNPAEEQNTTKQKVDVVPQVPPTAEHQKNAHYCKPDQTPLWKIILETGAVAVGILVAIIYYGQLRVMRGQLGEIIRQFPEIQKTADANMKSADQTEKAVRDAAANFVIDQRPWVYVSSLNLTSEPEEKKEGPKIAVSILNSGRTMALKVSPIYETGSAPSDEVPEENPKTFRPHESLQLGILPPSAGNFVFPTLPVNSITAPVPLGGYNRGAAVIYIHIKLIYSDIFGNTYWTKVCAFHEHGSPLNLFTLCKRGNEVGQEKR